MRGLEMYRTIILGLALSVVILPETQAQTKADDKANTPTITITKLEINEKNLKLDYEIRNDSKQDAWILVGTGESGVEANVFMDEDGRTLMIRNRLDVPTRAFFNMFYGRYVRLLAGKTQTESVLLTTPVHPHHGLEGGRQARGLEYAKRLAIEIGYYAGDMPAMILDILEKADKVRDETGDKADDLRHIKGVFWRIVAIQQAPRIPETKG
jgi:hypothetical protein